MFKKKETPKSKFKKCPKCNTETILAVCPYCKSEIQNISKEILPKEDIELSKKAALRRQKRLARKNNDKN